MFKYLLEDVEIARKFTNDPLVKKIIPHAKNYTTLAKLPLKSLRTIVNAMKYLHFLIILYVLQPSKVEAQIVYASTFTPQTSQVLKVNLETCTTAPLVDIPAGTLDMCIAPNGLIYVVHSAIQIESVDTLTGTITPVATLPNIAASGLEWGEDGFLYAISAFIFKINPTTGVVQNMGQFPAGWVSTGELVYLAPARRMRVT